MLIFEDTIHPQLFHSFILCIGNAIDDATFVKTYRQPFETSPHSTTVFWCHHIHTLACARIKYWSPAETHQANTM